MYFQSLKKNTFFWLLSRCKHLSQKTNWAKNGWDGQWSIDNKKQEIHPVFRPHQENAFRWIPSSKFGQYFSIIHTPFSPSPERVHHSESSSCRKVIKMSEKPESFWFTFRAILRPSLGEWNDYLQKIPTIRNQTSITSSDKFTWVRCTEMMYNSIWLGTFALQRKKLNAWKYRNPSWLLFWRIYFARTSHSREILNSTVKFTIGDSTLDKIKR